ncbi:MAG: PKD domain-containing protein [Flavobacteriales bacterium]|nr:PKD domain-containing protein [Flavobacteriales bacterium]
MILISTFGLTNGLSLEFTDYIHVKRKTMYTSGSGMHPVDHVKGLILLLILFFGAFQIMNGQTYEVQFSITPDCWGYETSWTLTQDGGGTIGQASTNTYGTGWPNGPGASTQTFNLSANTCYTFTINDAYGDGMEGSIWGGCNVDGTFTFTTSSGLVLAEMDNPGFGYSDTYAFCLTPGCTDSDASNYNSSANIDDGSCSYAPPTASFSSSVSDPECGYATVTFTNTSTTATSYAWTFQNGSPASSTAANPTVTFPSGGTFAVTLTATNGSGSNTATESITVDLGEDGTWITLVISPDCWGTELGWTLTDENDVVLKTVPVDTYIDEFPEFTEEIREDFCLTNGCYTIEFVDSYGDGFEGDEYWYCDEDGTYWFEDSEGNVFGEFSDTPDFGYSYSAEECISYLYIWKGILDSDWQNAGNWEDNVVPNSTSNVIIDQITYPPSMDENVTINNITINSGSAVEFSNSSGILKVNGHLTNNGTLDVDAGKIVMQGSQTQYVKGTSVPTFYELKINTNDSVRLLTDVEFRGPLVPHSGVFDFNGKDVVLVSDADHTGSIGEIKPAAEVIGDTITIHRYFPAASGSWRMLSTPIMDATFEQWNDDIPTTGFTGSNYPNYPSASNPWSNIRYYDETLTAGQASYLDSGFYSIDNITDTIGNSRGYFVYFAPGPTTIDVTGAWRKYDQSYNLDFSESNTDPFYDGWNLVANPYPSAISWDNGSGWSRTDLNEAVYAYDPIIGQYSSYVNGISIGALDGTIASTQAFWVKSESGSPEMTLGEAAKINETGVHMRAEDLNTETVIRIELAGANGTDQTVLGFHSLASTGFDEKYDAYKFYSPNANKPNLASVAEATDEASNEMGISMFPTPEEELAVDLIVKKGNNTEMSLSNVLVDTYDDNICLVLEDKELQTFVPFGEGETYAFTMSEESLETRFALHVSAPLQVEKSDETCPDLNDGTATVDGFGQAPWNFTWTDMEGNIIQQHENQSEADVMNNLAPGFYEVLVENTSTQCNSATTLVEIADAWEESLQAIVAEASCLGAEEGSIEIDLDGDYTWTLTLLDDENQLIWTIDDQESDTAISNLPPDVYRVIGISSCGNDFAINNLDLIHPQSVVAAFEADSDSLNLYETNSVTFYNSSSNALNFVWNFGDGTIDSLNIDGQHQYTQPGTYDVTLTAYNLVCTSTTHHSFTVVDLTPEEEEAEQNENYNALYDVVAGVQLADWDDKVDVNYGPTTITVKTKVALQQEVVFRIFNTAGQLVLEEKVQEFDQSYTLPTSHLAQGAFHLTVVTEGKQIKSEKFVKN